MEHIYLDYAATTPVDARVMRVMQPYFSREFGNAGSVHSFGQAAIKAVDTAREIITKTIGANFSEIIFTGSASEANNLVLRGTLQYAKKIQKEWVKPPRIIVSAVEHESVLATVQALSNYGIEVDIIPVNRGGVIDIKKLEAALAPETVLVSVMYANNEVGTVEPIAKIGKIIKEWRISHGQSDPLSPPFFHTDAVQAFQYLSCNVSELGVDLMTLSAHKIYGPKGVGALYARLPALKSYRLVPQITGGGQEYGMRSGTENVPLIVGFSKAADITTKIRDKEAKRVTALRDLFWREIKKIESKAEVNGINIEEVKNERLPNNLNVYFPRHEAKFLLTKLDILGLAASAGSACSARSLEPSYVIDALGRSKERAQKSIRFSLGRFTAKLEIQRALSILKRALV